MREQRPLMIQTSVSYNKVHVHAIMHYVLYLLTLNTNLTFEHNFQSQYQFVCETVLKVYQEGSVRPNPEFCIAAANSPSGACNGNGTSSAPPRTFTSWFTSAKLFN